MLSESEKSSTIPVSANQTTEDCDNSYRTVKFTGTTKEYFGIWISNLVLTVVTLGIYSAWAKVRRVQFFRNHTTIADFPLSYHATGRQLLIGRVIAVAIIATYFAATFFVPAATLFVLIAFVFVYPWLVNRTLRFTARMTSWRNIRFNWHGTYWRTFWYLGVFPLIGFAIPLLLPMGLKCFYEHYAQNHSFGTTKFDSEQSSTSPFYGAFFVSIVVSAIIAILISTVVVFAIFLFGLFGLDFREFLGSDYFDADVDLMSEENMRALIILLAILVYPLVFMSLLRTMCRNLVLSCLILEDTVTFNSNLGPAKFLWIRATNMIVMVCSLGLMIPWASIREYKYLSQCTGYRFEIDDAEFVDEEQKRMSALGEEFASLVDVDVSI